jgi:tetratricopeptide (TPR) repeat protein
MKILTHVLLLVLLLSSCKKFLDEKPDKKLAVPATLADFQRLLDDDAKMNRIFPCYGEASADNYYLTDADFNGLTNLEDKNTYLWEGDVILQKKPNSWADLYFAVNTANVILEGLNKISKTSENAGAWNNVKGSALFFRAASFYAVADIWALPFDSATASTTLGIPLRLSSDFNIPSKRSSLKETYDRILQDLNEAKELLPPLSIHVMRPSKRATYGILSRVHLSMRNYTKAKAYADSTLQLSGDLMDYNTLNVSANNPFSRFNKEVVFHTTMSATPPITTSRAKIDSVLYKSYSDNDLRKQAFFRSNGNGSYSFKGTYEGSGTSFNGITLDEMILTRAEGYAREGNLAAALDDVNYLLKRRMKTGTFSPVNTTTKEETIKKILEERRKELLMRGLRWTDLRRLNKEGYGITLRRKINNEVFELTPNDKRYALPFPEYVIEMTGMEQNPR